jgi:hypothetical protein
LIFQENITGPVPSCQNYELPSEFDSKFKKKKDVVEKSTRSKLKQLWELKVKMAKRIEVSPGPGAYKIDRDQIANIKYSFPKVDILTD